MEQNDRNIVGHYKFDSGQTDTYWDELAGLTVPVDKMFGKFVVKDSITLMGSDVIRALEDSGRRCQAIEEFRDGYLTPPSGAGQYSEIKDQN